MESNSSAVSIDPVIASENKVPARYSDKRSSTEEQNPFLDLDISLGEEYEKGPVEATTGQSILIETEEECHVIGKGTIIGSNEVVEMIGQGGMTCVYKVWNSELETFRCLKVIREDSSPSNFERFVTESKVSAQFDHQNIVHIFNIGNFYNLPFIEMEYIEGYTLQHYITKYGKVPDKVAAAVALGIARALTYIHSHDFTLYGKKYHGIIHRDLKPANIMITSEGVVKLMDFGIARPVETGLHTMADANVVGTMQYFSPEQLNGENVDHGTDIYALGSILYEMLTGCKTFPYTTLTTLIKKKSLNSFKPLNQYEFPIHTQLRRVSSLCLKTERSKRYHNADALLKELEEIVSTFEMTHPEQDLEEYISSPFVLDDVIGGTGKYDITDIHKAVQVAETKNRKYLIAAISVGTLMSFVLLIALLLK